MKKIFFFAALVLSTAFIGCSKDEPGGTATQNVAGQWYCTIDAVDDNGNPITQTLDGHNNPGVDYFGVGQTLILTYNTTANSPSEMWIDFLGVGNLAKKYAGYWEDYGFYPTYAVKTRVAVDQATMTFKSTESENIGEGYQWWRTDPVLDAQGDTVWTDSTHTEFETVDVMFHEEKPMPVTIEGKILKGAGHQKNGSVSDSIVFFVTYKDDPWYPDDGYTRYKVHGIRYSGLVEND